MNVIETSLPGVLVIEPIVHADKRGFFQEIWQDQRYADIGISGPFSQDSVSASRNRVLRGLHVQVIEPQGKLVYVLGGSVFDVAVDIRPDSAHFGRWFGTTISEVDHRQIWIPPGFAHGFCVLSEPATLCYKCTTKYIASAQRSIRWDDPDIAIEWPIRNPILAPTDADAPFLRDSEFALAAARSVAER
ncbi:MAG: dTDP-4-dehydrorhamnose 3,5-epimerase [Burkholderiales bacterium RIFCSPHIGHO2_12_FULL_61_11]|nr:MAG: dTDP-4-dehydrorhamnose 3,5-epimerase [Burkholderiales bacterium RIFCSPHIGHO2_12_FULL_61_11]